MPDRKSSVGSTRIEQVLDENRPIYLTAIAGFLKAFFIVYDALVFLPFKLFADPEKKRALSSRIKVCFKCVFFIRMDILGQACC